MPFGCLGVIVPDGRRLGLMPLECIAEEGTNASRSGCITLAAARARVKRAGTASTPDGWGIPGR
jgi:hypothetical protein